MPQNLYHCIVKIITVEQNDNWWYDSCTCCDGSVYKLEGRYKCSECHKSMPIPEKKYKIVVLAEDSTESFNFILKDKAAKRVIGRTATNLIAETRKVCEFFSVMLFIAYKSNFYTSHCS